MQVAIQICWALAAIGGVVVAILLYYHKQTPTVWVTFLIVVSIALAICLTWQDALWKNQNRARVLSDPQTAAQQYAEPDVNEISAASNASNLIAASESKTAGEWLYTLVVIGKENQALEYACKISDDTRRSEVLAYVAEALAKISKTADSNAVLTLAIEAENQVYTSGLARLRPPAVLPITRALVEVRPINEAIEFVTRYKGPPLDVVWALFTISKRLKCTGQEDEAKNTAYQALEAVKKMKEPVMQPIALIEALRLLASLREADEALKVAGGMDDPTPALVGIAKENFKRGDVEQGMQIINGVFQNARKSGNSYLKTQALAQVAKTLVAMGAMEKASEIADEARNSMPSTLDGLSRFNLLLMLSKTFIKVGRIAEASGFVSEAVAIVPLFDTAVSRANFSIDAARVLFKVGRMKEANEVLDEALDSAKQIPSDVYVSSALLNISRARAKFGSFRSALDTANLCYSSDHKLLARTAILREFSLRRNSALSKFFDKDQDEKDWPFEEDFDCSPPST